MQFKRAQKALVNEASCYKVKAPVTLVSSVILVSLASLSEA